MLPVGRSKNYSHSYEFRQIICPLDKHRRNKLNFEKIFKVQLFEVDIKRRIETVATDNYIFRFAA